MTLRRYKFLIKEGRKIKSNSGNLTWKIGEWVKHKGELNMCNAGLHCSKEPYDAFSFVQGEILAEVECRGKHLKEKDKECWEEMRIVKAYKWDKKASLRLAIYSAELVLKNFEKEYPNDKRPREAIEAAKKVLFKDTAKNRSAAEYAAWSAQSAAQSAWSAQSAAWSAARSAAWSAQSAWSAWSAAWSAQSACSACSAQSATIKKIQKEFKNIVKDLKEA